MKKLLKKSLAVILTVLMVSSSVVCFAEGLNQDAVDLHYGQYKNYVLLGDSVASGYRDEITENDELYNELHYDSTYYRYTGSYSDVLANAIIEDGSMTALAGPGYRTIEMRYMLEDDYAANCTDEYLFWPSHLYIWERMNNDPMYAPGSEYWRTQFKTAIAEADLITLGVGGNDWGAYLGWVVNQILEEENVGDQFIQKLQEYMANNDLDLSSIEQYVEIAHMAGALPALLEKVPAALEYGLGNFYNNWDIMIQDIYDLNPDVTLVVLGMSDNSLKGYYYSYPDAGVVGEPVDGFSDPDADAAVSATSSLIGAVMAIGNKPMIDGAEKFGYTYVDTTGTTYVDSHPDAAGHEYIANLIIESLPHPDVYDKFTDVTPAHKAYKDVEYVVLNGIMSGTTDTTFSPDAVFTKGQLAEAFNAINGTNKATDSTDRALLLNLVIEFVKASFSSGFEGLFSGIIYTVKLIGEHRGDLGTTFTRAEAASLIREFCER